MFGLRHLIPLICGCCLLAQELSASGSNDVPALFHTPPLDWLPSPVPVSIQPVRFPASLQVQQVRRMAIGGGRVWIAARTHGETNAPRTALWALSLPQGRLDPVRGPVESHSITDLALGPDGLWLAVDGGAALLDPKTLVVDAFSSGSGLTTESPVSFASAGRRWFTLASNGNLFALHPDGRGWSRLPGMPQVGAGPGQFEHLRGSADWILAVAPGGLFVRQHSAAGWDPIDSRHWRNLPLEQAPEWRWAAEDGDGGFWIGSNAGLHFLSAETGVMQSLLAPRSVEVPGGLGGAVPTGFKPTASAFAAARRRQAEGIREQMRFRARLGKKSAEAGVRLDAMTPTTRLPGPVRVILRDGPHLWVVCEEPLSPLRSRVLLFHPATRRWVAHATVPLPVSCAAADAQSLWLGSDLERLPTGAPVVRVEKQAFTAAPAARWVTDAIDPAEYQRKLAARPVRERAVRAFFAGEAQRVVELLEHEKPDAEILFLLAFAHDGLGLDNPERRSHYAERLLAEFPQSAPAEAVRSLRPVPPVATSTAGPTPVLSNLFRRRDTDGNGRITAEEWLAWKGEGKPMQPFDRNGDGGLDLEEFDAVLRSPTP